MDAAGRQEEDISGMNLVTGQHVGDGAVGHLGGIFLGRNVLREAGQQVGTGLGIHHIPHFGLSLGAVVTFGGQFIVGVYLDGKVRQGVDELDEQGKLVPGILVHMLSDERAFVFFHQVGDGAARQRPFGHDALVAMHAG